MRFKTKPGEHYGKLDAFTPDDGHFEYHVVATNLSFSLPALFAFTLRLLQWARRPRADEPVGVEFAPSPSLSRRAAACRSFPTPCGRSDERKTNANDARRKLRATAIPERGARWQEHLTKQ